MPRRLGPYQHGRNLRYVVVGDDGARTYETVPLHGPPPFSRSPAPSRRHRFSRRRPRRGTPGFVYFVQCGDERGPIKIGVAQHVSDRIRALQTACPYELRLLAAVWVADGCEQYERVMLERFAEQRIRGEWFLWSQELVDAAAAAAQLAPFLETHAETPPGRRD